MIFKNAGRAAKGTMRQLIVWELICLILLALASADRMFDLDWGFTPSAPYALAITAVAGVPLGFALRAIFKILAGRKQR